MPIAFMADSVRRVVVVDDDRDACALLAEVIQLAAPGTLVWTAHDGTQAIERTLVVRPDAVVMDLEMPVLDGAAAAKVIRERLGASTPVLIALSGNPGKLDLLRDRRLFDLLMLKPASIDALLAHLGVPIGPAGP